MQVKMSHGSFRTPITPPINPDRITDVPPRELYRYVAFSPPHLCVAILNVSLLGMSRYIQTSPFRSGGRGGVGGASAQFCMRVGKMTPPHPECAKGHLAANRCLPPVKFWFPYEFRTGGQKRDPRPGRPLFVSHLRSSVFQSRDLRATPVFSLRRYLPFLAWPIPISPYSTSAPKFADATPCQIRIPYGRRP